MPHLLHTLRRAAILGQQLTMGALPHGGQRTARRNAWSSMTDDLGMSRARQEAAAAMDAAVAAATAAAGQIALAR